MAAGVNDVGRRHSLKVGRGCEGTSGHELHIDRDVVGLATAGIVEADGGYSAGHVNFLGSINLLHKRVAPEGVERTIVRGTCARANLHCLLRRCLPRA